MDLLHIFLDSSHVLYDKGEPNWLKKILQHAHSEAVYVNRAILLLFTAIWMFLSRALADQHLRQDQFDLKQRSEITEVERLAEATNREEEMKLLNAIKE